MALALACTAPTCWAQQSVNVLFVGNSYTEVNNLPQMVQQIATAMGDQLVYQSNTPGGCTFSQHCYNRSMELICGGGWDVVVLQEQSQYPSFPQLQVEAEVFPYAQRLVDSVYAHNSCAEPMFYMTWGRKNGDAGNAPYFPVLGSYEGMDSMLCERYTYMAQANDASLCPVGRVWHYLRDNHPDIELYQSDESHPSVAGTYAAACAFYVMLFHRDPAGITYDAALPDATAQSIRSAVRRVVYERLSQWQRPMPQAAFEVEMRDDSTAFFTAAASHADSLVWSFGDGVVTAITTDTVSHRYSATGIYTVSLVALRHCMADTFDTDVVVVCGATEGIDDVSVSQTPLLIYPNPARGHLSVVTDVVQTAVTLVDMDGRVVMSCDAQGDQTDIDITGLAAGTYILYADTPTGAVTRRVVVLQ